MFDKPSQMSISFCSSLLEQLNYWDSPLGSSLNLLLTKNPFLFFLSLPDKPVHFTPAQPPDGKSSVDSPAQPADHTVLVPTNNDLRAVLQL